MVEGVPIFNLKLNYMKPGSLVTPRWMETEMWLQIRRRIPEFVHPYVKNLPVFGQIYTVKALHLCKCCGNITATLEELVVIPPPSYGKEVGLYEDFYVEIDPPQENIQAIVDTITGQNVHFERSSAQL